ncbi:hypothetical protein L1987_51072 [Smallanthus sonchifolius]|uniref:Uncharacterized protein n=1 Tax=Smallanthus sonchifolius TaxID=185202 RepID=A0ACB9ENS9_9ASTR|nr:hypothetical protein L1987_51072 [Smallanthus sonchifolius]
MMHMNEQSLATLLCLPSTTATLSLITVLKSSPQQQPLTCHQFKLFGVQRYIWAYKESVMYAFQTKMWA